MTIKIKKGEDKSKCYPQNVVIPEEKKLTKYYLLHVVIPEEEKNIVFESVPGTQ